MIKSGYTTLYVTDAAKAFHFYEGTFGFKKKFVTPEKDYGQINTGETRIAFASKELANANLKNGFIGSVLFDKQIWSSVPLFKFAPG